jgi:hypothetical protein
LYEQYQNDCKKPLVKGYSIPHFVYNHSSIQPQQVARQGKLLDERTPRYFRVQQGLQKKPWLGLTIVQRRVKNGFTQDVIQAKSGN